MRIGGLDYLVEYKAGSRADGKDGIDRFISGNEFPDRTRRTPLSLSLAGSVDGRGMDGGLEARNGNLEMMLAMRMTKMTMISRTQPPVEKNVAGFDSPALVIGLHVRPAPSIAKRSLTGRIVQVEFLIV